MSDGLKTLNFTFIRRTTPRRGSFSADDWNNALEELSTDFAYLTKEWNNKLLTLVSTIPFGNEDTSIDAFTNGLDGRTIWVDSSVTSSSTDQTYYDSTNIRPFTVKEAFDDVYEQIDIALEQVKSEILTSTEAITAEQKNRIGANIFDSSTTSSSTSLDGKSENNRLNLVQLAKDLYDASSYSLGNDGAADLTYSVKDMVDALLQLHNGAWNSDITVDHTGVSITVTQADINSSAPGDDSFAGAPTDLEEDLDQIRTRIKTIGGTAGWQSTLTALYAGGADSLQELLASTAGTGTKTAGNPWGYNWDDIDGLETRINAINLFVGQGDPTDSLPAYSSINFVGVGQPLELSISVLDSVLATVSGYNTAISTFVGQDNLTDTTPDYSSNIYINDGDSLETAIGKLDSVIVNPAVFPSSGIYQTEAFTAVADKVYRLDTTVSGFNVMLPTVSGIQSHEIIFKQQPLTSSGIVTVYPYGSETIDSKNKLYVDTPTRSVSLRSDGISDWMIVDQYEPSVFRPEWWGARADGTTDCTEALQSAIWAARSGGIVELQPGRYKVTRTLIPGKYPGNTGVYGALHIRGTGESRFDDIVGSYNYGSTIYMPSPSANVPVIDITGSLGVQLENLNIIGTNGPVTDSVAIKTSGWSSGTTLRNVGIWGWDKGIEIAGSVNDDAWHIDTCHFQFVNTAIYNSSVESYLIRVTASTFSAGIMYHTNASVSGGIMNSFLAEKCLIACSDAIIRYSSPSAAHNGRAIITLHGCVAEAMAGYSPWVFDCESLAANNSLGLTIKDCVINTGSTSDIYDPDFRFIRYYGRGPFIFEGNIVDGTYRFPIEICTASVNEYGLTNFGTVKFTNNVWKSGPPLFIYPNDLPRGTIIEQGNFIDCLPGQKSSDTHAFPPWPGTTDLIVNKRRVGGDEPTDGTTWVKGSTYYDETNRKLLCCEENGTFYPYSPPSGCLAQLPTNSGYAVFTFGDDLQKRKIYAGMYIDIGDATRLEVSDVVNDLIYLKTTWSGVTQSGAINLSEPLFATVATYSGIPLANQILYWNDTYNTWEPNSSSFFNEDIYTTGNIRAALNIAGDTVSATTLICSGIATIPEIADSVVLTSGNLQVGTIDVATSSDIVGLQTTTSGLTLNITSKRGGEANDISIALTAKTAGTTIEDDHKILSIGYVNSLGAYTEVGHWRGDGDLAISGVLDIRGSTGTATIVSQEPDGAAAVGIELNTLETFSTSGAKLLSVQNNSVEKFYVDKDGFARLSSSVRVAGDIGSGEGSTVTLTNTVAAKDSTNATLGETPTGIVAEHSGWLKVYIEGVTAYVPYWTAG